MNTSTIGLLAALVGVIVALGLASVSAQSGGTEVRIEARRLDDGRIEFALRERGTDDEWSDRVLPATRYFPMSSQGRWLRSSPLFVGQVTPTCAELAGRLIAGTTAEHAAAVEEGVANIERIARVAATIVEISGSHVVAGTGRSDESLYETARRYSLSVVSDESVAAGDTSDYVQWLLALYAVNGYYVLAADLAQAIENPPSEQRWGALLQQADAANLELLSRGSIYIPICGAAPPTGTSVAHGRTEVRIEARRLDDGRIEFALRERGADGEWGDRILPTTRYFPTSSQGRWLRSSSLFVGTGAPTTPVSPPATSGRTAPFEGSGTNYAATRDDFTDKVITYIRTATAGAHLVVACSNRGLIIWVGGDRVPISDLNDQHTVLWRVDANPPVEEIWIGIDSSRQTAPGPNNLRIYNQIRHGQSVVLRITGYSQSETIRFNLDGMFDTPAQWNIDNCGNY